MDEPQEDTTTSADSAELDVPVNNDTGSSEVPSEIEDLGAEPNLATTAGEVPEEEVQTPMEPVSEDPLPQAKSNNNRTVTIIVVIGLLVLVIGSLIAMLLLAQAA